MTRTIYLLRSVSGAGKTTLAETLQEYLEDCKAIAADDFHYDEEGNYNWLPENMGAAHSWCKSMVDEYMELSTSNIIVHNTMITEKEIKPYIDMAKKYGYKVVSLIVENRHGNRDVHNVPQQGRDFQEQRLRGNIKLQ